jgi:hypothetical protein
MLRIFESEPALLNPGITPPTPQALPNILEIELLPYRFCSVGGIGGGARAPGFVIALS